MKMRLIASLTLGTLAILVACASTGLALTYPTLVPPTIPEDPTVVLAVLGGAGVAWQYFRSRARK
jgi:hypothetical protein